MKTTIDFSFDENSEALVQPEVFKITIRNEVSSPAMRYFMSH